MTVTMPMSARRIGAVLARVRPGWLALAVSGLLVTGCGQEPIFESVGTSNTGKNAATSLSSPVPASTMGSASGDLLIAVLGVKINPIITAPSGWTALPGMAGFNGTICASDDEGIACQLSAFYKISSGSETSANFSWPTLYQAAGAVLRYSRFDAGSPFGAIGKQSGSSNASTAPSVTTLRSESRVLRIALLEADNVRNSLTTVILASDPPTLRFNLVSFPPASVSLATGCGPPLSGCSYTNEAVGLAASDDRQKTAGPSGTASWSLPGTDQWVGVTIEIKRPPGSGPVVQ